MTKCWYLVIFSFSFGVVAFQELADESSLNKVSFFISYDYASSCQLVCRTYSTVTILKSIDALYHGTFDAIELYMYYFFKTGTKKLWLWSCWSFKNLSLQICDELNNPTIRHVKSWPGKRGSWKCVVSKSTGRMYRVCS